LHASTSKSEWKFEYGCNHHIGKYASLFSSLSQATTKEIFVANDYALTIVGCGKNECQNSVIIDVYHVPSLSVNLLFVPQLT
jgi:hypothetical protein